MSDINDGKRIGDHKYRAVKGENAEVFGTGSKEWVEVYDNPLNVRSAVRDLIYEMMRLKRKVQRLEVDSDQSRGEKHHEWIGGEKCTWIEDEYGLWKTECGEERALKEYGTPEGREMNYCHYCGRQLEQVASEERNQTRSMLYEMSERGWE